MVRRGRDDPSGQMLRDRRVALACVINVHGVLEGGVLDITHSFAIAPAEKAWRADGEGLRGGLALRPARPQAPRGLGPAL